MNVIKRSGEEVSFDADKILLAIEKANQATQENRQISEDKITEITNRVIQKCIGHQQRHGCLANTCTHTGSQRKRL